MLDVKTPRSAHEWDEVRALMRAFVAWHRQRHRQDIQLVDDYFDAAAFDAELATLPGPYAPPTAGSVTSVTGDHRRGEPTAR